MMQIERQEHGRKGAFFIDEDGEWVAELTYFKSGPGQITVDHTEVDPKLRGENIGEDLVKAVVEFARETGVKIKFACPYAKKIVDETPEYQDILAS